MFCKHCGHEMSDGEKFCPNCGKKATENTAISANTNNTLSKRINWKSKKVIMGAIISVIIICLIAAISYFNSASYLEKKITTGVWYRKPYEDVYGGRAGAVIEFHLNGEAEIDWYAYAYMNNEWWSDGGSEWDWEIMKDKTLFFDGEYYSWNSEWSLSGNKLVIGDRVFYSSDLYGYEED